MAQNGGKTQFFVCSMMFSLLSARSPDYLFARLVPRVAVSARDTRASADLLELLACRTELMRRSFTFEGLNLWNALSSGLRAAATMREFKRMLYSHLLRVQNHSC